MVRLLALYSRDDGSRRPFFRHVGGKKKTVGLTEVVRPKTCFKSCNPHQNPPDLCWGKKVGRKLHVRGNNKKNAKNPAFFRRTWCQLIRRIYFDRSAVHWQCLSVQHFYALHDLWSAYAATTLLHCSVGAVHTTLHWEVSTRCGCSVLWQNVVCSKVDIRHFKGNAWSVCSPINILHMECNTLQVKRNVLQGK